MSNKSKPSIVKLINYLKDVQRESKQISWPPFNLASFQFIVVIVLSALITILLYFIDIGFKVGIGALKETIIK
ncbi:MAG: preprotein translocase subunit SecE [Candidatus Caenarcaniphilales bacterium]|nr:preprotein translocase subunit SecE [Candidatus Caenarcaniphilales bacterium]